MIQKTVLVLRMREGKPGGGKGPMMSEDKTFTIATVNDQTLFVFENRYDEGIRINDSKTSPTVRSAYGTGGGNVPMIAYPMHGAMVGRKDTAGPHGSGFKDEDDPSYTLTASSQARHGVATIEYNKSAVRRLTPMECERLQGFPDDWTADQSDSARYKQMGNAVAVPVVEWIVGNIVELMID